MTKKNIRKKCNPLNHWWDWICALGLARFQNFYVTISFSDLTTKPWSFEVQFLPAIASFLQKQFREKKLSVCCGKIISQFFLSVQLDVDNSKKKLFIFKPSFQPLSVYDDEAARRQKEGKLSNFSFCSNANGLLHIQDESFCGWRWVHNDAWITSSHYD